MAPFDFTHFLLGKTVSSNNKFANSRQLSLISQNYGTLRMKCALGETLRMKLVNNPNFEDEKCIFPISQLKNKTEAAKKSIVSIK